MLFLSEMVLRGMGLALLPSEMFGKELADGRLVRVLPRYSLPGGGLYIVWPSRALVPARVAAVRELLAQELAALGASAPAPRTSRRSSGTR
jgi:DNA-binding transcriptional LysR family regulator